MALSLRRMRKEPTPLSLRRSSACLQQRGARMQANDIQNLTKSLTQKLLSRVHLAKGSPDLCPPHHARFSTTSQKIENKRHN